MNAIYSDGMARTSAKKTADLKTCQYRDRCRFIEVEGKFRGIIYLYNICTWENEPCIYRDFMKHADKTKKDKI